MSERLSWSEIVERCPDEWVMLKDPHYSEGEVLTDAELLYHAPDKDGVFCRTGLRQACGAVLYTGRPFPKGSELFL